ncbi:MAG: hypothetical protein RSC97_07995 [Eubacterium sp.]
MGYVFLLIGCILIGASVILVFLCIKEHSSVSYTELRNVSINHSLVSTEEENLKIQKRKMIIRQFKGTVKQEYQNLTTKESHHLMEFEDTLELARKRVRNNHK